MISIKNKKSLLLIRNLPTSSFTQFSAQNAENGILGLPKVSKFSGGAHPQKKGTKNNFLVKSVTLLKPAGYFSFY